MIGGSFDSQGTGLSLSGGLIEEQSRGDHRPPFREGCWPVAEWGPIPDSSNGLRGRPPQGLNLPAPRQQTLRDKIDQPAMKRGKIVKHFDPMFPE